MLKSCQLTSTQVKSNKQFKKQSEQYLYLEMLNLNESEINQEVSVMENHTKLTSLIRMQNL